MPVNVTLNLEFVDPSGLRGHGEVDMVAPSQVQSLLIKGLQTNNRFVKI